MTIERIEDWSAAPFDEDGRKLQRSGYVYIVQCGRNQMKIGYSGNPEWRAKAIGYGGPATPLVLAVGLRTRRKPKSGRPRQRAISPTATAIDD